MRSFPATALCAALALALGPLVAHAAPRKSSRSEKGPRGREAAAPTEPAPTEPAPTAAPAQPAPAVSPEVAAQAELLGNDPARIYSYVAEEVTFELYAGALKTPEQVLASGSGNGIDQARLLQALLVAAGLEVEVRTGFVRVPLVDLLAWLQVATPEAALELLTTAGVPHRPVLEAGAVVAVEVEHAWVEARRIQPNGNPEVVITGDTPPFYAGLGDVVLSQLPGAPTPAQNPLADLTVREVVVLANQVIGGAPLPPGASMSQLVQALTAINEAYVDGGDGGFRTQTQGGWSQTPKPRGNNPGSILAQTFPTAFPNGFSVGARAFDADATGSTLTFTSAEQVMLQLPSGGTPSAFTFPGTLTAPIGKDQGATVLLGQTLTATLNLHLSDLASETLTVSRLDPTFERSVTTPAATPLTDAGLDPNVLLETANQATVVDPITRSAVPVDLPAIEQALTERQAALRTYLQGVDPTLSLETAQGTSTRLPREGAFPLEVVSEQGQPASWRLAVSGLGLSLEERLARFTGLRLTLTFAPASAADAAAIEAAGGLLEVAPGSVQLVPVLSSGGEELARGAPLPVGAVARLEVRAAGPGEAAEESVEVTAGGVYALVLDAEPAAAAIAEARTRLAVALETSGQPLAEAVAGEALHALALAFARLERAHTRHLAGSAGAALAGAPVTVVVAGLDLEARTVDGAPRLVLAEPRLAGGTDAAPVSRGGEHPGGDAAAIRFATSAAAAALAAELPAQLLGASVAAPRDLLGAAALDGVALVAVDAERLELLTFLELDPALAERVAAEVAAGREVLLQAQPDAAGRRGLVLLDPTSGRADFELAGPAPSLPGVGAAQLAALGQRWQTLLAAADPGGTSAFAQPIATSGAAPTIARALQLADVRNALAAAAALPAGDARREALVHLAAVLATR